MAYTQTVWEAGHSITESRMNKIEKGIADAHSQNFNLSTSVDLMNTAITDLDDRVDGAESSIDTLQRSMENASLGGAQGRAAWAQIVDAVEIVSGTPQEGNLVYNKTLAQKLTDYKALIDSQGSEISAARKGKKDLVTKVNDIEDQISTLSGGISSINGTFAEASVDIDNYNHGSVHDRIGADERKIKDLSTEMTNAHYSTAFKASGQDYAPYDSLDKRLEEGESRIVTNTTNLNNARTELSDAHNSAILDNTSYTSIDARFEAIEKELIDGSGITKTTRLDTIDNTLSGLADNKVNKTDIANNLTTENSGKVLDASQGKILKDIIDNMDTAYKAADTALDNRLDAIDGGSAISTTNGTLSARVTALETEVDMSSANSRIDTALSRLDAIDDASTGTIAGLDARIDALETTVDTQETGLSDRMTTAENAISHAASDADAGGLIERLTVVETSITGNGGIEDRLDAIDNTSTGAIKELQDADLALDGRLDAIDGGSALDTTNGTLSARVTTLEGKDTIIVDYDGEHSNYTEEVPNISNPSENADYLISDDEGRYFYWRYFGAQTGWQLVGGAGSGNGSSSGTILTELPAVADGDANIDYFIGNSNDGFVHYRFVEAGPGESAGHYIKILPTDLINDAEVSTVTIDNAADADKWPTTESFSGGLEAYAIDDTSKANNLLADFVAVRNARIQAIYDENEQLQSQKLQVLDTNGKLMEYPIVGGSGGGTTSLYNARITSSTQASRSIPSNSTDLVTISAKVIIQQGNTSLGENAVADGVVQYRRRGTTTWNTGDRIEVTADTQEDRYIIPNDTTFTVDVTKYLVEDITIEFRLAMVAHPTSNEDDDFDVYSSTFRVTQVNISIADESFDYGSVKSSNFRYNYRCFGSGITKTVHFVMDGSDIATANVGTSHDTVLQQDISMTGKSNGMHTFQVYFVTSTGLESNRLNYFILYNTDATRQAPLLGAAAENTSITDGDELIVNYAIYTPNSETTDTVEIELYTLNDNNQKDFSRTTVRNDVTNNMLADPPYRTFDYPKVEKEEGAQVDPDPITVYVKITASHTVDIEGTPTVLSDTRTVQVQVKYLNTTYKLEPKGSNNLLYEYRAYGHSNNDAVKTHTYPYTTVGGQTVNFTGSFNGFNWATDGYVDGQSLTIGGGATFDIDVPIFNGSFNGVNIEENASVEDITQNGRTIEIDYEVLSTTDLNATIIDCMSAQNIGFRVTPQNCYLLNSGSNIDIDETGFIKNEENVAAAYLSPGQRTHLTFVIEPWAAELAADNNYHQSTNIYINGEFANACPYNRNSSTGSLDGNNFSTNATISIGSDTCLIKLYSIKLYNRGLTEAQVLHNYEVAPVATRNKLERLEDNNILNNQGKVDYEKARKKYTCLLLTGMGTVNGMTVPTMAPYKGYPSVVGRQKDGETVGKTESGLLLTKPSNAIENTDGYTVEFNLQDKLIDPNNLYGYASSNNVQGTSSQKFPVKNLKVYLAKGDDTNVIAFDTNTDITTKSVYKYSINTAASNAYKSVYGNDAALPEYITDCGNAIATIVKNMAETPTQQAVVDAIIDYLTDNDVDVGAAYNSPGDELITHPILGYKKSKKVQYALRENGLGESTLCWKADYMSTDHANTFNANIANTLYSAEDRLSDRWTDQTQFAVYGIKCLLFQKNGENGIPEFVGDGCLNNDKGNHNTFALETDIEGVWQDENNNTMCQKWDFRNNTDSLLFFKHDGLFQQIDGKPAASRCLECIYPDEGDLSDAQALYKAAHNGETDPTLDVNYNHFQILSSWLGNRANYWYETDATARANKKNIFINEFRNHFNFNHILIYYLFMEYTALCDNRVKNIHMRTDNAGEEKIKKLNTNEYYFEGNSNPNSGPWTLAENLETRTKQEPVLDENGDYQFDQSGNMVLGDVSHTFVKDSVLNTIDWEQGEGHSNFAIWAPVLYDLDSCFSAENVGYLKVRYDAEWNYRLYNKMMFAGFDSILWLQVEDCFQDELKIMAKRLYDRVIGLNYSTFYRQQITDNLASLCPAVTNQDMILKYEKPWTEGFLDYSQDVLNPTTSTDRYKYLQRGTRAMQKAIYMKQRSLLLSSKYDANEFKQDKITFRAGTEVNHEYAVLILTANQKLYHGVQYGDQNDVSKVTRRAAEIYDESNNTWVSISDGLVPAFVPCRVHNIGNMGNTDGVEIYGASVLNDIGDLSRFHPYQIRLQNAVNLKKLILGSSASGYSNTKTSDIQGLDSCVLLEEINVCNCKGLTALQLSSNGFIKKVYATGSGLNTLSLPQGGVLDTIAYGENITDITIVNQGRLTNFSYENSEDNNYANVTRLWVENTPNVPIIDILNARLTPLASADAGLRAGGLRLVGINMNLGADPSFLELITSDLVQGTYLTAKGGHTEGTTQPPEISGTIQINSIRASLLAKLHEMYPNLVINAGEEVHEFEVQYWNYDGTVLLYTDHGTNEDNIIDPVADINPITNAPYIEMPTKPADAQYKYKFGLYNNQNKYRRFTGWVKRGTTTNPVSGEKINGDIILVAVFPTTEDQYYKVTWYYDLNGQKGPDRTVKYGTDLSSDASPIESGRIPRIRSGGNRIKVFKGWSCPLGKITHDVDVYALWEESSINESTEDIVMENLSAADIYALSRLTNTRKEKLLTEKLGQPIMVPMGLQFDYPEGVHITNLLGNENKIILDGTTEPVQVYNDIKPLSVDSDWTLALDYKFLMDSSVSFTGMEYVLASCYQNANSSITGFKISLIHSNSNQHAVQVSWGTQTVIVDYVNENTDNGWKFNSYRNVIVLNHNSDRPNILGVSYRKPNISNQSAPAGANYSIELDNTELEWTNNININTPLIIGGNYTGTTTNIENSNITRQCAQGIIYWAKYWDVDLGAQNCVNMTAWPHETVPFFLTGYNGASTRDTEQIYENSLLSFAAAQGMGDRYFYPASAAVQDSEGFSGWRQSVMRTICENLIYVGLPETYRAIINNQKVVSLKRNVDNDINDYEDKTYNHIFLSSRREIDESFVYSSTGYLEANNTWTGPWSWFASPKTIYQSSNIASALVPTDVTTDNYYLYRFAGAYISDNTRIFRTAARPTTIAGLKIKDGDAIELRSGDVWVHMSETQNDPDNNCAYIYFSPEDVEGGEQVDIKESNGSGWRKATEWALRSYNTIATSSMEWHFMRVTSAGTIVSKPAQSSRNTPRLLCPEFTV